MLGELEFEEENNFLDSYLIVTLTVIPHLLWI